MGAANEHNVLTDPNLHESKGFAAALNNGAMVKSERAVSAWEPRPVLPAALSIVPALTAPPTEVDGDIYVLNNSGTILDITNITQQAGTTLVKYDIAAPPEVGTIPGDYMIAKGCTFALNNGRFVIDSIDAGGSWIKVTNAERNSATEDEVASPGTANTTTVEWDGADRGEWVRFSSVDAKWNFIAPVAGTLVYIKDSGTWFTFTGSTTDAAGSETNIIAFAGGGQASAYQLKKKFNKCITVATALDSIKALDAFVGNEFMLINAAAVNELNLYPKTGQNFNGQAADAPFEMQAGTIVRWYCFVNGEWEQI